MMAAPKSTPDNYAALTRGLKIFVVVAGILLVLGFALLIYLIQKRGERPSAADERLTETMIEVPDGARLVQMELDGRHALVLFETAGGDQFLSLIDMRSGEQESLVRLP
ncbi:MAG: hypothetical protein ACFB6S_14015 [Geminicoccaceae bacterium]